MGVDDVANAIKALAAAAKASSAVMKELDRVLKILKMKGLIKQQPNGIQIDLNVAGLQVGLALP